MSILISISDSNWHLPARVRLFSSLLADAHAVELPNSVPTPPHVQILRVRLQNRRWLEHWLQLMEMELDFFEPATGTLQKKP